MARAPGEDGATVSAQRPCELRPCTGWLHTPGNGVLVGAASPSVYRCHANPCGSGSKQNHLGEREAIIMGFMLQQL